MSKKLLFLPALLGALMLFTPACTDSDPCKDVECGDNGTCFEGECICDVGYETDANGMCTVRTVDKFTGTFTVDEDCSASPAETYVATIQETGLSSVRIINVWNLFQNAVTATIDGTDKIVIARQEPDGDAYYVEGSGTLTVLANGKSQITFTYVVTDETDPANILSDNCSNTVYTQQ
ncbi:MAG: hypothetical protein R2792_18215 [Saprospiraceae bacterium]